jgi:lysozyme family protein
MPTPVDLFTAAMDFVWAPDNDGQPFHVTANDPGGATSWGVTFSTWSGWQQLHACPVSSASFMAIAKPDFLPLYRALYWNACCCGALGPIGIQVFDAAVNAGPGHAARFLQAALNGSYRLVIDGQIGPKTVAAAHACDQKQLSRRLCAQREEFYAHLPQARYFGAGWDHRAERCRDLVLCLLNSPPPAQTKET